MEERPRTTEPGRGSCKGATPLKTIQKTSKGEMQTSSKTLWAKGWCSLRINE